MLADVHAVQQNPPTVDFADIENIADRLATIRHTFKFAPGGDAKRYHTTFQNLARWLLLKLPALAKTCEILLQSTLLMYVTSDHKHVAQVDWASETSCIVDTITHYNLWSGTKVHKLPLEWMKAEIEHVAQSRGVSMVAVPVILVGGICHANSMVVDVARKTVDYFEPHGAAADWHETCLSIVEKLMPGYTVVSPSMQCPRAIGPQAILFREDEGFCKTWSLLYMLERILNPQADPGRLARFLSRGTPDQAIKRVLSIIGHAQKHDKELKDLRAESERKFWMHAFSRLDSKQHKLLMKDTHHQRQDSRIHCDIGNFSHDSCIACVNIYLEHIHRY